MQLRIVLQKSQTVENVVRKGTGSRRARVKMEILTRSVHEVISGEIVSNNLFLGKIVTENIESHPWEAIL